MSGGTLEGTVGLPPDVRVFFYDPDGIKLEIVHRPFPFSLSFARGMVRGAGSIANQVRRRRRR